MRRHYQVRVLFTLCKVAAFKTSAKTSAQNWVRQDPETDVANSFNKVPIKLHKKCDCC